MSSVVVAGGGPACVMLLERIVANHRPGSPLEVHLVDPHPTGSGRIWRATQSPLMRMNSMAADVTMYLDDSVTCAGPIRPGPSLADWVREVPADQLRDPALLPLIRSVSPTTFPDRRVQGEYLAWVLRRVIADAGPDVTVHEHRTTVVAVDGHAPQTVTLGDGDVLRADVVVLALGHVDVETPLHAAPGHVLPAYSADVDWDRVPAGEPAIVRGLGLAFVDIALLLTEARGGQFTERADGGFDYHPSGREPLLWAGSRRGMPHHSKTAYPLQGPRPALPAIFTPEVTARLAARGDLDFRRDVWPWISAELRFAHYHELALAHPERVRGTWAELEPLLLRVEGTPVHDPVALAALVPEPVDRLDLATLDKPLQGQEFGDPDAVQDRIAAGMVADVVRRSDPHFSADLGAFLGLLACFAQVARLVQLGAFEPTSLLRDVDGWWRGFFSHIASGPPPDRVLQLVALARAGIIRFLGAGLDVARDGDDWVATTSSLPGHEFRAATLIEARLPKPDVRHVPGPLVAGLLRAGAISEEVLVGPDGTPVATGLLRVDQDGRVRRADGEPDPDRFALGALTDIRAAAAFSRPNTNAPTFRLTDTIARAVLERLNALAQEPVPAAS